MRDLRIEMILEMVQVLEEEDRERSAAEEPCPRQLAVAGGNVRDVGGDERKAPTAGDHQRSISDRSYGDRDQSDAEREEQHHRNRLADDPGAVATRSQCEPE